MNVGVARAAQHLAAGELVAFPTETVYGLGADATNPAAVAKIFALKGRPTDHPLIVHLADAASLDAGPRRFPTRARGSPRRFWPGPLTLILRKAPRVPRAVTGGQDTVAIRCPSHPVARALLREFARVGSGGIAAPSANRFGHVSPTTAQHVRDEFGPGLPVLDGGACEVGLESTIVDLSRGTPVLLRPGGDRARAARRGAGRGAARARRRRRRAPPARSPRTTRRARRSRSVAIARRACGRGREGQRVAVLALAALRRVRAGHWMARAPRRRAPTATTSTRTCARSTRAARGASWWRRRRGTPAWEAVNDRLARAAAGEHDEP